jgi:hypothetical protein
VHEAIYLLLEWRFLSPQTRHLAELLKAGLEQPGAEESPARRVVDGGEVNRQVQMEELHRVIQSLLRSQMLSPELSRLAELFKAQLEKQIAASSPPEASAASGAA